MRKILALAVMFFLIIIIFSGTTYGNSNTPTLITPFNSNSTEPDIVKKQLLIESAKITDIGMQAAKEMLEAAFFENITESDVAQAAEQAMINSGSSEYVEAFGVIVASGEQSALPHGDGSDDEVNQILVGEVVVVDLGARYRGYCTDLTRTFFMGPPTDEMMEVYNITLEAQEVGMNAVRAGELARDVDKAARDVITKYGYGENFTHGLGHGIGLYIHMPPILDPNSNGILFQSSDMAISIEPGIYLEGRWGVRIEDDVMVQRSGSQLISHTPKTLAEAILSPEGYFNSSEEQNVSTTNNAQNFNVIFIIGPIIILIIIVLVVSRFRKKRKHEH